ncbi:MAG: cupin domain-containing protein [Planctomycetota bacterium]|jgi:mannose-6-phosphate isomerase-like protein (cupin superfamily)
MMFFRRDARVSEIDGCHGGVGKLKCVSLLSDEWKEAGGRFRWVHDDVLEPRTTIAEHKHEGDEELYVVLEGTGTALLDGERHPLEPGDVYVCRSGHTHGIENDDAPMRLIVVSVSTKA